MTAKETRRRAIAAGWIKELLSRGVTVAAIADRAGVHYNTVRMIRDNPEGNIDDAVYRKLEALVTKDFNIGGDEERASKEMKEPGHGTYGIEKTLIGFRVTDDEVGEKQIQITAPESARDFYERFEFHGGKVDWLELDEDARSFYENLHSLLLRSIDSVNERYAAGMRELRAVRERELRAALEEFEKTFHKRMLGLLGN